MTTTTTTATSRLGGRAANVTLWAVTVNTMLFDRLWTQPRVLLRCLTAWSRGYLFMVLLIL